ncbi:uncharacterized protein LOC111051333 [Nilaparvata lugens]|uniref:uncharacterized protein LOC111051333 n=1 Tax=Nilaparvata lugens TaxID=108931 RepID=UPI00193D937E|nr:uncharacterized protein LOC111051333 [Nilaparvata lugens]
MVREREKESVALLSYDMVTFIDAIRSQPLLWDRREKGYNEKKLRDECWDTIGQQMFKDWEGIRPVGRKNRVNSMKKKWRHLRDHFCKLRRMEATNPHKMPKKSYLYSDNLSFLSEALGLPPLINNTKITGLIEVDLEEEKEDEPDYKFTPEKNSRPKKRPASTETPDDSRKHTKQTRSATETPDDSRKHTKQTRSATETPEVSRRSTTDKYHLDTPLDDEGNKEITTLEKHRKQTRSATETPEVSRRSNTDEYHQDTPLVDDDGDRLFLLSMAKDLKIMNETEKLDFKIMCLQFFKEVRQRRGRSSNGFGVNSSSNRQSFGGSSLIRFNENGERISVIEGVHLEPNVIHEGTVYEIMCEDET